MCKMIRNLLGMIQMEEGMDEGPWMRELIHEWMIVKIRIHAKLREAIDPNEVIGEAMKAHVSLVKVWRGYDKRMRISRSHVTPRKQPHPHVRMRMILEDL